MDAMINVGANKETIIEARMAIIEILKCGQEQATIQAALGAFTEVAKVEGTTISGCSFTTTASSPQAQLSDND
jgi:hypothetical protein